MKRLGQTSITVILLTLAVFIFSSGATNAYAQQGPEFIGSGTAAPNTEQNLETQHKLADMKNYLGAGRRRYVLEDSYLRWPLSSLTEQYSSLNGEHIKQYLNEITAIAQQSRDEGNQYWGRIVGSKYDMETDQWLMEKLKAAGVQDVRRQELDVPPQWWGNSWAVSIADGGTERKLESAFPFVNTPSTPTAGLDLATVYVGLGRKADFAGRDVRGKAVVVFTIPSPGIRDNSAQWYGAVARAEENHAAAVFVVFGLPGNFSAQTVQPESSAPAVPTFLLGQDDGIALMDKLDRASPGAGPHIHLRLDATMKLTGQKTGLVWGVLPGATDETIYVMSPLDSFFTGAMDNASGIATMVTLAEHYAKIPKAQRRRTIIFVGTPGHHDGDPGTAWMHDHKDTVFNKSVLILNCAHVAQTQAYIHGPFLRYSNAIEAHRWVLHGSPRLEAIAIKAFADFGVTTFAIPDANGGGALGRIYKDAPSMFAYDMGPFYHTTGDIPQYVPAAGLEAGARAYAEIIDEVNKAERADLLEEPTSK